MIKAEIFTNSGKIVGFSINGHSGAAPIGKDIYCAGVSALSDSTFLCITDYLKRDVEGGASGGSALLKLKTPPDELTEAVFQTLLIGLKEIEKLVPTFLKVTIK
ncbi:MAG: ribosomal-processing cysteine protease Prp [Selenomonadaceae bacterium]|nr:ribosomal-processing cysteine protease Prp [Selenomonadaceae bacterium]